MQPLVLGERSKLPDILDHVESYVMSMFSLFSCLFTLNQIKSIIYFSSPFDSLLLPSSSLQCSSMPANILGHGPALESYRCFKLVIADTKSQVISNTVKFHHSYLSSLHHPQRTNQPWPSGCRRSPCRGGTSHKYLPGGRNCQSLRYLQIMAPVSATSLPAPAHSPLPAHPRVPPHEPPRVSSLLPPTPGLPQLPVPSWSPPPRPAAPTANTSERLDLHQKCYIQKIVGSLLYYAQAVTNKLLFALSTIAAQQSCATVATEQAVYLLLDYVATYPSEGIIYQASDMALCAHSDAGFLNVSNSRSCTRAHIFLSENKPFLRLIGAALSIAQIIKFVMASATKSELAALFVMAR
jgi:hypothetical protein